VIDTAALDEYLAPLRKQVEQLVKERDEYRKLYLDALERCKRLERGLVGKNREKLAPEQAQLSLSLLATLLSDAERSAQAAIEAEAEAVEKVRAHERHKPTGRKPLPEHLPRVDIEVLPPEVQQQGLDAFERIGEEVTETVERRPASLVVVRVHKPKFVQKDRDRLGQTTVLQAAPPELPIERGLAGPGLLADTLVRRWQDHLPLNRLEKIYAREGLELARSTVCGWHAELHKLAKPLVDAMWQDARGAPYLLSDATGVLVQEKERCRRGHFWVVAVPERHVLFAYTKTHDKDATKALLGDYKGALVADASAVFDHLYRRGEVIEVACWAHARRYFYKALATDPDRANQALALIGGLFRIERKLAQAPPASRLRTRQAESRPIVEAFFTFCDAEALRVLSDTPIAQGLTYARNQRVALQRFLEDGRLPLHNNWSERELRREAVGRKNWLFVGSDEAAEVNATFVSLLASCQLHGIEPWAYLRDLLCLLPRWPMRRVLDLAPAFWNKTLQEQDTQQRLADNVFRPFSLAPVHPQQT